MAPNHRPRRLPLFRVIGATSALLLLPGTLPLAGQQADIPTDQATVVHVLNRVTFGPRPGDVARVEAVGLEAWLEEQLHPERIDDRALDARLATFETLDLDSGELMDSYFGPAQELQRQQQARQAQAGQTPPQPQRRQAPGGAPDANPMMTPEMAPSEAPAVPSPDVQAARRAAILPVNELMQARVLRATMSERQLEEVLVDFWFNHFNVFVGKGQVRQYLTEYEREAIRPYVLGSFRDMLGATAKSPAMLFYLDNFQSRTETPALVVSREVERRLNDPRLTPTQRDQLRRRIEMQQARRPQPQQQRQGGGLNENYARELMELHTLGVDGGYTQDDVIAVARIMTGWTIDQPRQGGNFIFRPVMHDTGEKTALGVRFPAGHAQDEGERLLDILAAHPSTAHHIAYKLAQRFVADEPPAALVDRVAQVFLDTDGDLREVTRAVLLSPEFLAPDARRTKIKTPLEFVVSALRATGATVVNPQPVVAALGTLGMPLYGAQPPTGYSMTADAWVNTGALLARMNIALQIVEGGLPARNGGPGNAADRQRPVPARAAPRGRGPIRIDVAALAPDTSQGSLDQLVDAMLAGEASAATRETLSRAGAPEQLIALVLGSPEFQRR